MPEIARFYSIVVRMFGESGQRHHVAHIHVYYQEESAVYGIDPVRCLAGHLPRWQRRLVEAWIELYQNELARNWELIDNAEAIQRIPPFPK